MYARIRLRCFQLAIGIALSGVFALGCEDPLAGLNQAKQAMGKRTAASSGAAGEDFADDEDAKASAGGLSLGVEHAAKRLYYQFVDARGRVRFVERLSDVPEQWRERVGFVEMDTPPPLSPMMAKATRDARYSGLAKKVRQQQLASRRASTQVVLYSADWCGWCKKAKSHLDAKGINYVVRDIDDSKYLNELVAKTGQKGIPVLDVGGRIVTGFNAQRYDQLIREAV
jgi:glutaredoxin 3